MNYTIRKATENDLSGIIRLCKDHAAFERCAYEEEGKEEGLHTALFSNPPKLYCYVVEIAGNVVGYFSYTFDYSTWDAQSFLYLDCLYLDPEWRGQRIGESIFTLLRSIATENNCVNIQWQTPSFNERAIKFYHRIGGTGKDKVRFFINISNENQQ